MLAPRREAVLFGRDLVHLQVWPREILPAGNLFVWKTFAFNKNRSLFGQNGNNREGGGKMFSGYAPRSSNTGGWPGPAKVRF
jgi:hypothetical protein